MSTNAPPPLQEQDAPTVTGNGSPGNKHVLTKEEKSRMLLQQRIGIALIVLGLLGFMIAVMLGEKYLPDNGGIPAASILFVMIGMAFFFPDLLQGPDNGFSTMRMIVFMVVTVFVVLSIKIGWGTRSFDEFRLDSTWVYILGLAFGSKVFQTFGEKGDTKP